MEYSADGLIDDTKNNYPNLESQQPAKQRTDQTRDNTSGATVKISKGIYRGCIGKVSARTNDGISFIERHSDDQHAKCDRMPHGPFLDDELEEIG